MRFKGTERPSKTLRVFDSEEPGGVVAHNPQFTSCKRALKNSDNGEDRSKMRLYTLLFTSFTKPSGNDILRSMVRRGSLGYKPNLYYIPFIGSHIKDGAILKNKVLPSDAL